VLGQGADGKVVDDLGRALIDDVRRVAAVCLHEEGADRIAAVALST
jgi:hypothetical protein